MIPISLKQLAIVTEGTLHRINDQQAANFWINTIEINSRNRQVNSLFIALKGKNFDSHSFLKEAIMSGASALLIEQPLNINYPHLLVKDTHLAMAKIAAWIRLQSKAKVLGLTGSSGKTSVKEMLGTILSQCGMTLFTKGNLNNSIGVPLTLFRLTKEHQYIVIEMGANHTGEIAYSTNIVKPDSVLINNLFSSHLEGFGSFAGIANAKGEIFQGLSKQGTIVINLLSNDWKNWRSYFKQQQTVWTFSIIKQQQANFYAKNITIDSIGSQFELHTPIGIISISLPLLGIHNVANALAASALAISAGATLEQIRHGLINIKSIAGRLYPIYLAPGKLILDDTYNSNIGSIIAGTKVLSKMSGYRVLVISDVDELGNETDKYHQEIGILIHSMKLDLVLSIGQKSIFISQYSGCGEHFISKKKIIKRLILLIKECKIISVLVKGSRRATMEEIIYALQEYFLC